MPRYHIASISDTDRAVQAFQFLEEIDPHRLESMDKYSSLLFDAKMKREMAALVQKVVQIDKSSAETLCVIGESASDESDLLVDKGHFL